MKLCQVKANEKLLAKYFKMNFSGKRNRMEIVLKCTLRKSNSFVSLKNTSSFAEGVEWWFLWPCTRVVVDNT